MTSRGLRQDRVAVIAGAANGMGELRTFAVQSRTAASYSSARKSPRVLAETPMSLSPKHNRFVTKYPVDLKAAERAGYSNPCA
jgi:hypothetical protein